MNLLRDHLLASGYISMDETPTQVLKEPGKSPQSQSYLWVQRGGPPEAPVILFDYDPSRSQEVPLRLLAGFQGILQTDGYAGYYAAIRAQGLIHAGCLAHARRRFDEVIKSHRPCGRQWGKHRKKGLAEEALVQIQALYRIEKEARAMSPAERQRHREIHARPVWDTLRTWLSLHRPGVPPQSALGRALTYLANELNGTSLSCISPTGASRSTTMRPRTVCDPFAWVAVIHGSKLWKVARRACQELLCFRLYEP